MHALTIGGGDGGLLVSAKSLIPLGRAFEDSVLDYRKGVEGCRGKVSRKSVHRLRIAIRRMLACLELMGPEISERPAMRRVLLRQLRALGGLRDAQVQLHRVTGECRRAPDLLALREYLRKRRRRRSKAALKELAACDPLRWLVICRADMHAALGNPRLGPRVRRLIDRRLQQAIDPLFSFTPSTPADSATRHRARVLSREFRYMVEALRHAVRGREISDLLASLCAYQRIAGKIHDNELLLKRIDHLVADERLAAEPVRRLRSALQSEKAEQLRICPPLDQRILHQAMLACRFLRKDKPPES